VLVPAIAVILAVNQTGTWQLLNEIKSRGIAVSEPQPYVLSDDPVVVYVKDFISHQEAAHLVNLAYAFSCATKESESCVLIGKTQKRAIRALTHVGQ
jgi:hypothetical protein